MLPAFGLAGSFSAGGFKTKAEALHFAIVFTATLTESGNEPNYDKAQTLYKFITKNVKLPNTELDFKEMTKAAETFIDDLWKKFDTQVIQKGKESAKD